MSRRIKCAHCKSPEGHETVAQVRLCAQRAAEAKRREVEEENLRYLEQERTFDMEIQERERAEDLAVASFKAYRDDRALEGFSRTRRRRPW